jgi:hypothetical protein
MELKITLSDRVGRVLEERAAESGRAVEALVEAILETAVTAPRDDAAPATRAEFEAGLAAFSGGTEGLPPYAGTYSREDIYFDHD